MPSLGPAEILVILVVALLVFGPNKMPDVARQAGKAFREFRRVQHHLRNEISGAMSEFDLGVGDTPKPMSTPPTPGPMPSAPVSGGHPEPMLEPKDPAGEPQSGRPGAESSGQPPVDPT